MSVDENVSYSKMLYFIKHLQGTSYFSFVFYEACEQKGLYKLLTKHG